MYKRSKYRSFWFCLMKTRSRKSRDYRNVIVFQKLRFQTVFRSHENEAFSNSCGLKSVFDKFYFLEGLVWTEGLTIEKKSAFSNCSSVVWTGPKSMALGISYNLLSFWQQRFFFVKARLCLLWPLRVCIFVLKQNFKPTCSCSSGVFLLRNQLLASFSWSLRHFYLQCLLIWRFGWRDS